MTVILDRLRRADTQSVMRALMAGFIPIFMIAAVLSPDLKDIFNGFLRICISPAQLTRDYFRPDFGGLSGTMLNFSLVSSMCLVLTFLPGARINGGTILAYFLTIGFGSYGINPINILPLMLGVMLYALYKHKPIGSFLNYIMLSTGTAPLISEVLFRYPDCEGRHGLTWPGIAMTIGISLLIGFALVPMCAHCLGFHKGYDLYNAGPVQGFLCFIVYAVLYKVVGVTPPAIVPVLGEAHWAFTHLILLGGFGLCLLAGIAINGGTFAGFGALLMDSGYKTDFTEKYRPGLCLMNLGLFGLFVTGYYDLVGASFNGVTFGVIICMVCCCCSGATVINILPIIAGYFIGSRFGVAGLNQQGIIVGLCFACGLAPVTGEFGVTAGVLAGLMHYLLVTSVPAIHGGFNLYNGGFTAGIVGFLLVPMLEHYGKRCCERKHGGLLRIL